MTSIMMHHAIGTVTHTRVAAPPKTVRLDLSDLKDAPAGLARVGFNPQEVRLKVANQEVLKAVGNWRDNMPYLVVPRGEHMPLAAEFRKVIEIHSIIPEASVAPLGSVWKDGKVAAYLMEEIHGISIYHRFMEGMKADEEAAKAAYIRDFKALHRNVNKLNMNMVGHGDLIEGNVIGGRLIDPRPSTPSGIMRRPLLNVIYNDRRWLYKMAERIAFLTGASVQEVFSL